MIKLLLGLVTRRFVLITELLANDLHSSRKPIAGQLIDGVDFLHNPKSTLIDGATDYVLIALANGLAFVIRLRLRRSIHAVVAVPGR